MLYTILIVFHVVLAAGLVAIVLVQRGPGATMGAAFGAGASGTVFGSRGSASFLTRTTTWLGIAFFAISLTMAVLAARSSGQLGPVDDLGVAGALQSSQPAGSSDEAAEEEFLTLPLEGDEPVIEQDEQDGPAALESDAEEDGPVEQEPPLS